MIAGGGGAGLTKDQPENNIIRGAYYAMVSALSGTQTMALCSYDEAYTIPTEKAAELSLRTMQILAFESGACDTVDPLAGSYYVESLTDQMEDAIRKEMQKVEDQGGIIRSIASGKIQEAVSRQAYKRERSIQKGDTVKVGVNRFKKEEESKSVEFHPYNHEAAEQQIRKLEDLRKQRDDRLVRQKLKKIREEAEQGNNLMYPVMEAVKAYATVGEITNEIKEVYGAYEEPVFFKGEM